MSAVVTGVPELIAKLNNLGTQGVRMSAAVISSVADMIVADAKASAPADLGAIRQGLGQTTISNEFQAIATVYSAAPESPFQEFGTGPKVDVPADMADVAAAFRGKSGGDFKAFVLALTEWVKRKGINPIGTYQISTRSRIGRGNKTDVDEQTAYAIARAILIKGLKPQPFLYPAYVKNITKLIPMLQTALNELMRANQA